MSCSSLTHWVLDCASCSSSCAFSARSPSIASWWLLLGLGQLVARVDEGHQVLQLRLLVGKLAVDFLERAGLHRQLRLGGAMLFGERTLLGFKHLHCDFAVGMLGLQPRDRFGGLADLGQLHGGAEFHLLDARLQPSRGDGDLSVQLSHVGFDVGHHFWRDGLEPFPCEAPDARVRKPFGAEDERDRDQNPDANKDNRLAHCTKPRDHPTQIPQVTRYAWGLVFRLAIFFFRWQDNPTRRGFGSHRVCEFNHRKYIVDVGPRCVGAGNWRRAAAGSFLHARCACAKPKSAPRPKFAPPAVRPVRARAA